MIPTPIVTGAQLLRARSTITAAQINALDTTPVLIAPGIPGKILGVALVIGRYTFGTTPYNLPNGSAPAASLRYGTDSSLPAFNGDILVLLINDLDQSEFQISENSLSTPTPELCVGQDLFLFALEPGFSNGPILTATLNAGGASYAPGDTGNIDQAGSGGNATFEVDTVDGDGAVLTFHLTARGTKYTAATGLATTTFESGTGFLVDITITPTASGDGSVQYDVIYQPF